MKIYDISLPISPTMTTWPGDPPFEIRQISTIREGDEANISKISMCVHTGTHIDAPSHFIDGSKTIENIPLKKLIGTALVMDIGEQIDVIDEKVLCEHPEREKLSQFRKVLFKTKNALLSTGKPCQFDEKYVGISTSGANFLARQNLDLVGLDYLSVATYDETEVPHKILLSKEIVLLEGINLREVLPGIYDLYCLPLPILGSDGAPARAILVENTVNFGE